MRSFASALLAGTVVSTMLVAPSPASGQVVVDRRQDLIDAATRMAIDDLLADVEKASLVESLTVSQFLEQTTGRSAGRVELRRALSRAKQVGGPRFLDGQSVQVQLEMEGPAVARILERMAAREPAKSPVDPQRLVNELNRTWAKRTFRGTGTSAAPELAQLARPVGPLAMRTLPADEGKPDPALLLAEEAAQAWSTVPTQTRVRAIDTARRDAVAKLLAAAGPVVIFEPQQIPLQDGPADTAADGNSDHDSAELQVVRAYTFADALAAGSVGDQVTFWLDQRPVTRVTFLPERIVEVELSVEPRTWTDVVRRALTEQAPAIPQLTDDHWSQVAERLARQLPPAIGRGDAGVRVEPGDAPAPADPRQVVANLPTGRPALPAVPPAWVEEVFTASSTAPTSAGVTRLLVARAAEKQARADLQASLFALPLREGQTLGDVVQADPKLLGAFVRTLEGARVATVEYAPDGSATARVSLTGQDLWRELRQR